tara:strand:+ start:7290 stop:7580 length:291 start_codon:yes stop_codon:yes gene_type:complete
MAITPLDLAAIVWKDCRSHLLQNGDIRDAAETVVATLMETYDEAEIREAFKFDGAIKMAVGDYTGSHDEADIEDDIDDDVRADLINDDGEFDYDEY